MDELFGPGGDAGRANSPALGELRFHSEAGGRDAVPAGTFGPLLEEALSGVVAAQAEAKAGLEGLATADGKELHEVLVAMGKSEVAFQLMLEVRNKLMDAWREITRLPI